MQITVASKFLVHLWARLRRKLAAGSDTYDCMWIIPMSIPIGNDFEQYILCNRTAWELSGRYGDAVEEKFQIRLSQGTGVYVSRSYPFGP